jgi:ornithine cyclodeaminase/alanine dehydrogenase-like protein (mu-crystallin family)
MDSTYLTAVRTGLADALAAHVLATPNATAVAVIGAGVQGTQLLQALASLRPLQKAWVHDTDRQKSATYARALGDELGLSIEAATSVERAVAEADIVFTATISISTAGNRTGASCSRSGCSR